MLPLCRVRRWIWGRRQVLRQRCASRADGEGETEGHQQEGGGYGGLSGLRGEATESVEARECLISDVVCADNRKRREQRIALLAS